MSFLGLSIARSTFSSHYENGAYAIDGTVSAAGLAKLFDDTRGTISSKGTISGKKMVPQAFRADYTSGKKVSAIDIRFANGAVTSTQVIPAPGQRDPNDWVPIGAGDLASVLDPIHIISGRHSTRRLVHIHKIIHCSLWIGRRRLRDVLLLAEVIAEEEELRWRTFGLLHQFPIAGANALRAAALVEGPVEIVVLLLFGRFAE